MKLYIYNPTCDLAVENGTLSYMPPASLRQFEEDISPLMSFMANSNDVVYSRLPIDHSFIDFWEQLGFPMPKFMDKASISKLDDSYKVEPWGWSPLIAKEYKRFKNFGYDFKQKEAKRLFSRYTSIDLLHHFIANTDHHNPFIHIAKQTKLIKNSESIAAQLEQHDKGIVLKTMYSSSGRGLLFINDASDIERNKEWIEARIKAHGAIAAEPYYNKLQDASLQFLIEKDRYDFLGLNFFDADAKGRFAKEHFRIPHHIKAMLPDDSSWIDNIGHQIIDAMKSISLHRVYNGSVGVDALFFKTKEGKVKFNPLLEANLRCNMGLVNLHIKTRIHEGSRGTWQIDTYKPGEAKIFYEQMLKQHPISMLNEKIKNGFAPLSPFTSNTRFAAWMMAHSD